MLTPKKMAYFLAQISLIYFVMNVAKKVIKNLNWILVV